MKEENYFMFLVDIKNWKIVETKNIVGTENASTFQIIKPKDKILIYIIRLSEIRALYEVVSTFVDSKRLFSGRIYPYRVELKLIKKFEEKVNFKDIISKLDFIKNKQKWHGYLFGIRGIRKLSLKDFNTILENLL